MPSHKDYQDEYIRRLESERTDMEEIEDKVNELGENGAKLMDAQTTFVVTQDGRPLTVRKLIFWLAQNRVEVQVEP